MLTAAAAGSAAAGSSGRVTPGVLRSHATLHSIGLEWDVAGDTNHNAICTVQFRERGSARWRDAFGLFRIDYAGWYGEKQADRPYNMMAGSILFLQPATAYELKLDLSDPDGGRDTRTVQLTTRPVPSLAQSSRTLHVVPGEGGGDGSPAQPFQGLAAAQAGANPGDVLLLHRGRYPSFQFDKPGAPGRYLAWQAAGDGDVVLNHASVSASHLWFDGLIFQTDEPGANGLVAEGAPKDVVVCRNRFTGFHYSILLSSKSKDWYLADNVIVGDKERFDVSEMSGEGIELNHSRGHSVCFNRISRVADGISYPDRDCDLFGNDIRDVTDDGLDWDQAPTPFWWHLPPAKPSRFSDLAAFAQAVGIEQHALRVRKEDLFTVADLPAYLAESFPNRRLTLKPGCAAIDAGQPVANLCDGFAGKAPDLGAYEFGLPAPHYGPRTNRRGRD